MSDAALGFYRDSPDTLPAQGARVSDPALLDLITVKLADAAATLHISERKLRRLMAAHKVPVVKMGERTHGILLNQLYELVAALLQPALKES
jgi:hypothetical protein